MDTDSIVESLLLGHEQRSIQQTGLKQQLECEAGDIQDLSLDQYILGDQYFLIAGSARRIC